MGKEMTMTINAYSDEEGYAMYDESEALIAYRGVTIMWASA